MRLTIEKLGQKGDGLATLNGKTIAVPKTLPGETVEFEPGQVALIIKPSVERVAPFCAHFEKCGGCKFQHMAEAPYQQWKQALLAQALQQAGIQTTVLPLKDAHGAGRRRVSLHVRLINGVWVAGFMEQRSHDLIALKQCPILVPALGQAPQLAAAFGPALGACDVSITAAENGLDVSIKAERKLVLRRLEALNEIMRQFSILRLSVNGEVHAALATPTLTMGKASVGLPLGGFLQATDLGESMLASLVLQAVGKSKAVADLFCGVGPFALRLAEKARVTAIDSDKPAISCLQAALRNTQGLKPVIAQPRDLFREPLTVPELNAFDAVVLDPPRAGAEAQSKLLAKSNVARIVMVSCDIATFVRDAAHMCNGGYSLKTVTPVDQFKYTPHLEMVGIFEKA